MFTQTSAVFRKRVLEPRHLSYIWKSQTLTEAMPSDLATLLLVAQRFSRSSSWVLHARRFWLPLEGSAWGIVFEIMISFPLPQSHAGFNQLVVSFADAGQMLCSRV